jgi:hypothetical protein
VVDENALPDEYEVEEILDHKETRGKTRIFDALEGADQK